MRLTTALLAVLLAPQAFSQTATSPGEVQGPERTATESFHDDTLHLSYRYPSTYIDASALVKPALQASISQENAAAAQCVSLPLSRMAPTPQPIAMVLLIRADAGCLKKKFDEKSMAEFAEGEAKGIAASGARTNFAKPVSFKLAGRPASSVTGSFTLPTGQTLQARVVCVLDQPDVACWQFLASTPEALDTLAMLPVTFDGSAAATLTAPAGR